MARFKSKHSRINLHYRRQRPRSDTLLGLKLQTLYSFSTTSQRRNHQTALRNVPCRVSYLCNHY